MFKVGDYVVYGMQGACRIQDITEVDFAKSGKLYYILVPVCDEKGMIYVSVDNGNRKMRSIMSQGDAADMIQRMPKLHGKWIPNERERDHAYKQAILNGNYEEMIEIMAGLVKKASIRTKQGKRQTELDERILRNMKRVLFGELSIVLQEDVREIEQKVLQAVS